MRRIFRVTGRTIGGLGQRVGVLGLLNVGLDHFSQIAVPNASHLQREQYETSQETNTDKRICSKLETQSKDFIFTSEYKE